MKKLILTIIATAGLMAFSFGQYVDQALIFSQQNYGSTARSKAMGNAFGAIGGDFSSLSINPAGIGIYQKSEFSSTLNLLGMNSTDATYQGQIANDQSNNFSFRNLGFVMANPVQNGGSGLVSLNWGFGFNKLNNFNQNYAVSKNGSPHSRMDAFAENSYGINKTKFYDENNPYNSGIPWESKLAWENYLMDVNDPTVNSYNSILLTNELVNENMTVNKEGYNNEVVGTFGANFNHKLYLGATIGWQLLYYNESTTYSEDGEFGKFDYSTTARTSGKGINLKLGMIYRPIPSLRIGAAIHTPTYFSMDEEYSSIMSSNLQFVSTEANGAHRAETPLGNYQYKMETPTRAIASLAYQFGKMGMISCDYEYVDYSKMKIRNGNDGYNFSVENTDIKAIYQSVGNLRLGAECKPTEAVSLRAGYELFGNPYKSYAYNHLQANKDYSFNTINLGVGYRIDNVYLDVAYSHGSQTNFSYMYQVSNANDPVKYDLKSNSLVFTLGIKL